MGKSSMIFHYCLVISLFVLVSSSSGEDTIQQSQNISDGQTLVSAGGIFVLGYLGIWFAISNTTVVWVANRDKPLNDSSGILRIDSTGNLVLAGALPAQSSAQLLDSGNFVLREGSSPTAGNFLWQSFDHPTDTMLAGMKIGPDYRTGRDRNLTAWRNASDPSPGRFTYKLDPRGMGQPFVLDNTTVIYRSGPWNGIQFSGSPSMKSYPMFYSTVVQNQEEAYYQFGVTQATTLTRLVMDHSGKAGWQELWSSALDRCSNYLFCGPNGVCNGDGSLPCNCLPGFRARNQDEWDIQNWSRGCERNTSLNCADGDGFLPRMGMRLPDTVNSTVDMSMNFNECKETCRKNCSCAAYASANISGGESGCITWTGDLVDLKTFGEAQDGQNIYLRLAKADIEEILGKPSNKRHGAVIAVTVALALVLLILAFWDIAYAGKGIGSSRLQSINKDLTDEKNDLPLFDLGTIELATNKFADGNKIGKEGLGKFVDGQEVAVKRLSSQSGEGIEEFKTEVRLIAKLQHRNLVRLLGCCIEGGERLLVYEYMPNSSLDVFIFGDEQKRLLLDWEKRLDIILGVARGLLYLHQDSRLRVIHRDLKAANILLDEDLWKDQMEDNTVKIVGTIGYMSPEYIMSGNFSEKSDIFSFGVLVLEIISGRKNQWISQKNFHMRLLANAWRLCTENQCDKLLDDMLRPPNQLSDVLRYIQIGLLCVQESPDDRPTMQEVVFMLANRNSVLPRPEKPGFFKPTSLVAAAQWFADGHNLSPSVNVITLTNVEGR
ncbi:unnamed protein product [Spirodela intermedia]|uniref:Receptor-like serine/threonine-protein kinase n=1 Tax=Spirodela intermedia TaxID=51605 RepID=A0A7I8IKF0_SPIIN|nr:unnamed protein product [Spirodela intermedia]CAA6658370.1 unnamed protein product [Spirodela intermedia]